MTVKFLVNENISQSVCNCLRRNGVDAVSVTEYAYGLTDNEVIEIAENENRIIVSFDKDFGRLVLKKRTKVPGVILLRFTPQSISFICNKIMSALSKGLILNGRLIVIEKARIRIRIMQ